MPDASDTAAPAASLSLTRAEAESRASTIRVEHTHIALDLTRPGSEFGSEAVIRFVLRADVQPGAETFVDFKGSQLTALELNGEPLDPTSWQQGRIPLTGLQVENTLRIAGVTAYSSDGEGLHRHTDPADQKTYLYAMSFLAAAPRWFGCFDQPDLKSTYTLDVTAPVDWTVLGNGPSTQVDPGRWQIRPIAPLSTYFVTLVAGPYASSYHEHDGIRLGFHARSSLAESLETEAADLAEVTAASFDYYHRLFGVRYPFGEYHQAFVPDFNAGAMENPGCVTLRDQYIYRGRATRAERASRAGTIAHELAHMWFGDLVTMRWWDDLWLNESFAEYASHRCCSDATVYPLWTEFGIVRKDWGSVADQGPSTHPVAGNGAPDAEAALQDFDGISYAKGAAVLKQLVAYLGDDVFVAGLRDYFERHAYGNATLADLLAAWQRAGAAAPTSGPGAAAPTSGPGAAAPTSGHGAAAPTSGPGAVDLGGWAQSWLRTTGMDTLSILDGELVRTPSPSSSARRTHTIAVAALDPTGAESGRRRLSLADDRATLDLTPATVLVPDADDDTWAKIRFEAGWPEVAELLPRIDRASTRVVVVNAVRDAVRGGEIDPGLALQSLLEVARTDREDIVVASVLRFCAEVVASTFTAAAERPRRWQLLHRAARSLVDDAASGSDRQLVGFRYAVGTCADAAQLRRWLDGVDLPPGLVLDPDLVWAIVVRLAEVGGDGSVVDEALDRDPSASGRTHAARARAALPTAAAKRAAWTALVEPSDLPASELYAIARGFFRPSQTELTAPYVDRFFVEMPGTAAFRSGWALGQLVSDAFPLSHATPQTLARAEETLGGELPAAVRRSMADGADVLRRAVISLARFAGPLS